MVEKIIKIPLSDLKEGMIIAKDLEHNNSVVLKKEFEVTEAIAQKVQKLLMFGSVEIYNPEYREIVINPKKQEQYDKIEDKLNNISLILQQTFQHICDKNPDFNKQVKVFTKAIKEEIKSSGTIIKNVVLHGSGEDPIYRHGVNVAILSALLGTWLNFSEEEIDLLIYSAMVHDLGKSKIDPAMLDKNKRLTDEEFKIMKSHTYIGYNYIKELEGIDQRVIYGVLMHHEREDGSGYPLKLKSEAIHPFGKIIAIADVFDAINSNRGYKDKRLPFEALQIVKNEGLGKLNCEYVKVFLEHIQSYYLGQEALLNNGAQCQIIQMNINNIEKPLVFMNDEFIDLDKEKDLQIKELLLLT